MGVVARGRALVAFVCADAFIAKSPSAHRNADASAGGSAAAHDVRATHTLICPISSIFSSAFSVHMYMCMYMLCAKAGSSCHHNTALARALLTLLLLFTLLRAWPAAQLKASC